jgi:lipoate-protein ligase A
MGRGITETYRVIAGCLMNGLGRGGIECAAHDSGMVRELGRETKLPCFLAPNREEIMVGGKKLIGSAQKRSAGAVLQHGSIPLTDAYRRLPKYLRINDAERLKQTELLAAKSCCVGELIRENTFESVVRCLMDGFSAVLPFKGEVTPWSREEKMLINGRIH